MYHCIINDRTVAQALRDDGHIVVRTGQVWYDIDVDFSQGKRVSTSCGVLIGVEDRVVWETDLAAAQLDREMNQRKLRLDHIRETVKQRGDL